MGRRLRVNDGATGNKKLLKVWNQGGWGRRMGHVGVGGVE